MSAKRTVSQIMQDVQDTLFTARLGLEHLNNDDPKIRMAGLRNVVVFGRAITNVLQNLRSADPEFDTWYQPHVEEMRADPLLKYFYTLRSQILKEGDISTSMSMSFSGNPMALMRSFKAPPRAKSFFIGDSIGGSGWEIETEEGSTEKYYVAIPEDFPGLKIAINVHLSDAPDEFRSRPMHDVCSVYLDKLNALVGQATKRYCGKAI